MAYVPTETGHFVNEDFARIAEIIKDYDHEMELAWIPPDKRRPTDIEPYAVIHRPLGGKEYVMFYIREDELDERVLARIFNGDLKQTNVIQRLEAYDHAVQVLDLKKKMEQAEARQDFIKSVVGSHKHSFRHNGKVIPK
jgi:hypothetical protein